MKKLALIIFFLTFTGFINQSFSQTYTTESKSCGSCHKKVSNDSRIGMRCPHCGVRWGYENETRSTGPAYSYRDYNDYETYKSSGFTTSKVNLRSGPSTKSRVKAVIPSYTNLTVISRTGSWYYVEYSYFNGYSFESLKGYVHKSLI